MYLSLPSSKMVLRTRTPFPRFLRRESSVRSLATLESTESTTKSHPKSRHTRRTRVRFEFDENDQVKSQVCVYPAIEAREKDLCYTPRQELKQYKRDANEDAADFVRANALYVQCLETVFNSPLKCGLASGVDEEDALHAIGECEVRGLEGRMSPLIGRHKQWAVKSILRRQEQLRSEGMSAANSAEILRVCCEHVNKSTRELALKYAMADELQAQKIYEDLALQS